MLRTASRRHASDWCCLTQPRLQARLRRRARMAGFAAEVKLFGKWSFEDVEVRRVTQECATTAAPRELGETGRPEAGAVCRALLRRCVGKPVLRVAALHACLLASAARWRAPK